MQQPKAIVIGSGVAGMAAAVRLAVQGYEVDLFEQNSYPGGKLSLIEKDGYRFDAGPSLFTQPQHVAALFELAGEPMEHYFQYQPVPLSCRYFYENGKVINGWTDAAAFGNELAQHLGEDAGALEQYLQQSRRLYETLGTVFLNNSLHKRDTWLQKSILPALGQVRWSHLFGNLHQYNSSAFKSAEAVQLFDRFATYNGSNPYQTPGMMSMIPHLELNEGTFYPMGGMISITEAVHQLAIKKGVRFHFNTPVQRIIHHQGRVRGVVVEQDNYLADIVVSNVDVYFTYRNLLQAPVKARQLLKQERSCSGVIFYWGIGTSFPQLHLHNIFFSSNYKAEFDAIFRNKQLYDDPTVYVNITSKMEAGQAPEGKENWFVLINAPANGTVQWQQPVDQLRKQVISKLSRMLQTDLAQHIEVEEVLDPAGIESRTGSYLGALYGTSSNNRMAAFLRHANFNAAVKGLYFCGGSVHPGGGIPLCFKSAEIVGKLVAREHKLHTA